MKQHSMRFALCLLTMVLLLTACGKQAAEEPSETDAVTQPTQSTVQTTEPLDDGELPQVTLPQQTQPVTEATEGTQPTAATEPTQGTKPTEPPETSEPTEGTDPSEPTQPPETTVPTEPTEPPFDEDELPPVPVG